MTERDEAIRARCEAVDAIKLPCDVKLGHTTVRKGCSLGSLLLVIENRSAFEAERDARLKTLMEESEKLKDECTDWLDDNARMSNEIACLESALVEAQRRAEAAERDMWTMRSCQSCAHKPEGYPSLHGVCADCDDEDKWEWRGPDKEDTKEDTNARQNG